jgi:hypothetical protein
MEIFLGDEIFRTVAAVALFSLESAAPEIPAQGRHGTHGSVGGFTKIHSRHQVVLQAARGIGKEPILFYHRGSKKNKRRRVFLYVWCARVNKATIWGMDQR